MFDNICLAKTGGTQACVPRIDSNSSVWSEIDTETVCF